MPNPQLGVGEAVRGQLASTRARVVPLRDVKLSQDAREPPSLDVRVPQGSRSNPVREEKKEKDQIFRSPSRLWRGREEWRGTLYYCLLGRRDQFKASARKQRTPIVLARPFFLCHLIFFFPSVGPAAVSSDVDGCINGSDTNGILLLSGFAVVLRKPPYIVF